MLKSRFFQHKTSFSAEKYERKIPEKISDVSLDMIYLWFEFEHFFIEIMTSEKMIQK